MMRSRMLWTCKHRLMNALSRVPFHETLHFAGQRALGKHKLDEDEMFGRAMELFLLLRRAGGGVRGRAVLEIGTGWFPFAATLACLFGAKEVVTVDIHPWLTLRNALRTFESARRLAPNILDRAGVDRGEFAARCEAVSRRIPTARSAEDLFAGVGVRYLPKTDLLRADLPAESFDVVLSSNVLEHIPPGVLERIYAKTADLTRQGGFAVHRFNPDDHYKTLSGSTVSFLEYSENQWRRLGGYGLAYHNRMRTSEHASLVHRSPWTLVYWADALDSKAARDIDNGSIVPVGRFANMPTETLAAWYSWFVMRKGCGAAAAQPERVHWIDEKF